VRLGLCQLQLSRASDRAQLDDTADCSTQMHGGLSLPADHAPLAMANLNPRSTNSIGLMGLIRYQFTHTENTANGDCIINLHSPFAGDECQQVENAPWSIKGAMLSLSLWCKAGSPSEGRPTVPGRIAQRMTHARCSKFSFLYTATRPVFAP
jgi:hypothetical protein